MIYSPTCTTDITHLVPIEIRYLTVLLHIALLSEDRLSSLWWWWLWRWEGWRDKEEINGKTMQSSPFQSDNDFKSRKQHMCLVNLAHITSKTITQGKSSTLLNLLKYFRVWQANDLRVCRIRRRRSRLGLSIFPISPSRPSLQVKVLLFKTPFLKYFRVWHAHDLRVCRKKSKTSFSF